MNTTLLICLIVIGCLLIINIIMGIFMYRSMKNTLIQTKLFMYEMQRKTNNLDTLYENMNENVESLSTGFVNVQKSFDTALKEKINMKRFPLPDEIAAIDVVMHDQIDQIIGLTSKQRIPNKDMYETIVTNVCRTFPHIEIEYIVRKLTAFLESANIIARQDE